MSSPLLRDCILAAAGAVESARDELCRLDAGAGDGDHGVTMALAARGVRQQLADAPEANGADLLTRVALAAGSVGGAIGPIYASGMLAAAAKLRALQPGEPVELAHILACAEAAESAVAALGGAKPGDKTILDALNPAVVSLRSAESTGLPVGAALSGAAGAALAGAAATASMKAALGRASRLGERSVGMADPGATSFALMLDAIALSYAAAAGDQRDS
ncbi:MAG TPA: DAK2 domain-containing protein [Stellaceae bacterium]|nr:DAK2 domain-containing protein [Stellaceae bacterium]